MSAILAIDPGQTTGLLSVIDGEANPYQIKGRLEAERFVYDWIDTWQGWFDNDPRPWFKAVVIERYHPEVGAGSSQLDALYIIGAVEWMCSQEGIDFHLQSRTDAKTYSTRNKLHDSGLWEPTVGLDHARDAARHYLYWMMTNDTARNLPERKLLKDKLLNGLQKRAGR